MSACMVQAMSQVGCRLMVASSANTSRPLAPAACGDIARALATKAAMSSEADGSDGSLPDATSLAADVWFADLGLTGSPDMPSSLMAARLCGERSDGGQCAGSPPLVP